MLRINDVVIFGEARYRILDVSDIRYIPNKPQDAGLST